MFHPLPRLVAALRLAFAVAVVAAAFPVPPAIAQQRVAAPLSLSDAVASAADRSGLVAAVDAQAQAARETAVAADRLPDPVLKLGIVNLPIDGPDRYSLTRDFMTMRSIGLMQEFTRDDKRRARGDRATREVETALVMRQAVVADLQRDAAWAWLERSFQESLRALIAAQIEQAELQARAVETAYRGGRGSAADVLAARTAVEELRDALDRADRQVAIARTRLARWVGSDVADRPLAERPDLDLPAWAVDAELSARLLQHPLVAAAAQQQAVAESEAALARAAKSADWSIELMFNKRGPAYSDMVSINVSVPLQWDQKNRQDRELAARLAGIEQARQRRDELQRASEADVRAMVVQWRGDAPRLRRYDDTLLPLARQRSEAALAAYRSGSGSLAAVFDARRAELDVRVERLRIETELARVWAQLNYLLPANDAAGIVTGAAR